MSNNEIIDFPCQLTRLSFPRNANQMKNIIVAYEISSGMFKSRGIQVYREYTSEQLRRF